MNNYNLEAVSVFFLVFSSLIISIKLIVPTITDVPIIHGIRVIAFTDDIFSINASLPKREINIIPPQLLFII